MRDSPAGKRVYAAAILSGIWVPVAVLSAAEIQPSGAGPVAAATRVLHFPKDQCLGVLHIEDRSPRSEYAQHNLDPSLPWAMDAQHLDLDTSWESVGVARGDGTVPADRDIALRIVLKARPSELVHPNLRDRCFPDPEDLTGLSGLDPNDLGMLFVESLGERTYADERVVKPLSRLTGLKMLRLHRTGMTNKGMEYLKGLHSLRSLELAEPRVDDAGLAVLKDLSALEYLDLWTKATGAGFKHVGQLPNLRWLRIRMGWVQGPGLAELTSLPRLERLCLWGETGLTDQHVKRIEGLTHLKSLTLWGTDDPPLTDASLASIGKLTSLEELYFVRIATSFTGTGVAHLKSLKRLKKVDFGQARPDDAGMRDLATMSSLVAIKGGLPLTAGTAKTLPSFGNLTSLDVSLEDRTAPVAVPSLYALASLEELRFTGARAGVWLSDDNLVGLESLGRLKSLLIGSDQITDQGLTSIGRLGQLESLNLRANITRRGLNQLGGLTHLRTLDVKPSPSPSGGVDEVPLKLSALTDLQTLSLHNLSLRDEDLASLAGMRQLDWLVLDGTFTEDGLQHLGGLAELRLLNVTGVSCSDGEGLGQLSGLKRLEDLTLRGRITDAALARLPVLPSLWSLRIVTDEPIRPETVARLKQILPMIEYIHIDKPPGNEPLLRSSPARRERTPANLPRVNRPTPRTSPRSR
jgi:hypothetical protein